MASAWPRCATSAYRFFRVLWPLLKPGAHAVIVVGNSLLKGIEFQVDRIFADIARMVGFDAAVEVVRSSRVGSSIVGTGLRSKPRGSRIALYEAAVILHKSSGASRDRSDQRVPGRSRDPAPRRISKGGFAPFGFPFACGGGHRLGP
ncbi:MAG: hypothetical protein HYU88_05030 [Chloroflexi bacterium]|nr:hypothetical protein [Chloroflexota bacterium]